MSYLLLLVVVVGLDLPIYYAAGWQNFGLVFTRLQRLPAVLKNVNWLRQTRDFGKTKCTDSTWQDAS